MFKFDNTDEVYSRYPFLERVAPRAKILGAVTGPLEPAMFYQSTLKPRRSPRFRKTYHNFYLFDWRGNLLKQVGKWWIFRFDETIAGAVHALSMKGKRAHYVVHVGDDGVVTLYGAPSQYRDADHWVTKTMEEEFAKYELN